MEKPDQYDAIVIGAGQGGGPLSTTLANAGMKTALIEREHVGGTCINKGCTPTKTMIASARAAFMARRAADFGVRTGSVSVNMKEVRNRKREIVENFRNGSRRRIVSVDNLELVMGEAAFVGEKILEVRMNDGRKRRISADRVFINTGSNPAKPQIEGLGDASCFDSTSVMEVEKVPEHLLIIGGGYVGLEFAQMFRRFGSSVTLIQRATQLLPREDTDVAEEVKKILEGEGVEILLEAETNRIENVPKGRVRLRLRTPSAEMERSGTDLLLATGRVPNTDKLNPGASGIRTDERGYVAVNNRLETNVPGVFALGDVKGGPGFTHISYDDYRILRTNLIRGGDASTDGRLVPYTVFIDPQLGRVGITEKEAKKRQLDVRVATMPMSHVARAIEVGETRGFMKAIIDSASDQILGCAILGTEGGEIAALLQIAMMGRVPAVRIRDGIFSHPTLAESLNNLFKSAEAD